MALFIFWVNCSLRAACDPLHCSVIPTFLNYELFSWFYGISSFYNTHTHTHTHTHKHTHKHTHTHTYIYIYIYILPYPRRDEFSYEWSNRVAISVYCKALHIWIELSVAVKRLRDRVLDWRLSQPGFDPSYGKLVCLATLMSSDWTKQICLWMTLYVYLIFTQIVCRCLHFDIM